MSTPYAEVSAMAIELQRRPITVEEYHRMQEVGIIGPDERIELLRGDLIEKPKVNPPHRICLNRLNEMLVLQFHGRACVQIQMPVIVLDDSEPEPDVALLTIKHQAARTWHEYARDALALVEVSDKSRERDVRYKAKLYAEAGVREYWVVDLVDNVIRVNRDPDTEAKRYRTTAIRLPGERIGFEAFPDDVLAVDEILPYL
jgi:Uma2 family endonuclease